MMFLIICESADSELIDLLYHIQKFGITSLHFSLLVSVLYVARPQSGIPPSKPSPTNHLPFPKLPPTYKHCPLPLVACSLPSCLGVKMFWMAKGHNSPLSSDSLGAQMGWPLLLSGSWSSMRRHALILPAKSQSQFNTHPSQCYAYSKSLK